MKPKLRSLLQNGFRNVQSKIFAIGMFAAAVPMPAFAAVSDATKNALPFLTLQDFGAYGILTVATCAYIFAIRYMST